MKDEKKIDNKNEIVKGEETASKMKANEQAKAETKAETVAETVAEEEKNTGEPEHKIRTVHGQQIDVKPTKKKEEGLKFNSFKERIEYYWDYYKWTVGVAVALVFIAFMLVRSVIIEMKPPIIYIAMMNAHMDSPGDATFGDDYGNQRGLDPKSGSIKMDTDFIHPMTIDDAALKNDTIIASMQRFTAAVTTSNIDIAITNPWVLKDYMENEIFYNLEEIYTEEELKQLEDLLWYEADSTGKQVPVGVIINGHRDIDSFYDEGEVIVIGIPRDSKRVERAKDFVAWMLEG
ncbi:MAG: hypothetical protein PUB54_03325 [Lachnospiraceae bacterium]|nr:hypothetical protein [Lachnospiraceae bacterium]